MPSGKTAAEAVKDPLAEKLLGSDYYKKLSGFTKDEWARSREKRKTKERNAFTALYSDYLAPLVLAKKPIIVVGGLKTTLAALSVDRVTNEVNGICNSVEDTSAIVNSLTKAYDSSIKVPRNPNLEKLAVSLDKVCNYLSDLLDRALIEIGHESIVGKELLSEENYDKVRKGQEACKNLKDKLSQIKSELKSEPKPEIPPKDDGAEADTDEPESKTPTKTPSSAGTGKAAAAPGKLTDEDKRKTLGDLAKAAAEALREKGEPGERNEINDSLAKKLLKEHYGELSDECGTVEGEKWEQTRALKDSIEQQYFGELKEDLDALLKFKFDKKNELNGNFDTLKLKKGTREVSKICDSIKATSEIAHLILHLRDEEYDWSTEFSENLIISIYSVYNFLNALLGKVTVEIGHASIVEHKPLNQTNYGNVLSGFFACKCLVDEIKRIEAQDTEGSKTETDEKKN